MVESPAQAHHPCINRFKETEMATPFLTRMRTRWQRDALDEKLAFGADPAATPELSLRAKQLQSDESRDRIAGALEQAVHEVSDRWPPVVSQVVPLDHEQIHASAGDVVALARRLRDSEAVEARGVAMAARIATNGAGPLYRGGTGELSQTVRAARLALDATAPAAWDLRRAA